MKRLQNCFTDIYLNLGESVVCLCPPRCIDLIWITPRPSLLIPLCSISIYFALTQLNVKTALFQVIQFSISTYSSSLWPLDSTLSGATTPNQSGPESDDNEGVPCIPQNSSIPGASPSDCSVSYLGHSLGESYPCTEMQLVYSTAQADWANLLFYDFMIFTIKFYIYMPNFIALSWIVFIVNEICHWKLRLSAK